MAATPQVAGVAIVTARGQSRRWYRESRQAVNEDWSHQPDIMSWLTTVETPSAPTWRNPIFTDTVDGKPVIRLPARITFGSSATKPIPGGTPIPDDGITFSGKPPRLVFYSSGRGKLGTIYVRNEKGASYALSVSIVGRIFVRTWNPENNEWADS